MFKEKSKEFNIPKIDTPIIHGVTEIVLKNVKTGLVEKIVSENTFQSAVLAKQFPSNPWLRQNPYNNDAWANNPLVEMAGGLLLFRDAIQIGSYYPNAGNIMVGNGANGITNSEEPTELGSYNSIESSIGQTSITQVFDFPTSHGNGTIGCVCLTSKACGYGGFGNRSGNYRSSAWLPNRYHQNTSNMTPKMAENGKGYYFSISGSTMTVRKYRLISHIGSVFEGKYTETTHDMSELEISGYSYVNGECSAYYIGNNKFVVEPIGSYSVSAGNNFYYWEYDCANDTFTKKSFNNSSAETIKIINANTGKNTAMFFKDGNVAIMNDDSNAILFFKVSNSEYLYKSSAKLINTSSYYSGDYWFELGAITDGLYIGKVQRGHVGEGNYLIIDVTNETEYPTNYFGAGTMPVDFNGDGLSVFYNSQGNPTSSYIAPNPMYLLTINNLQSPVTKTAAQTMKVTYTLTEA